MELAGFTCEQGLNAERAARRGGDSQRTCSETGTLSPSRSLSLQKVSPSSGLGNGSLLGFPFKGDL